MYAKQCGLRLCAVDLRIGDVVWPLRSARCATGGRCAASTGSETRQYGLTEARFAEVNARLEVAKNFVRHVEADASALRLGTGLNVELLQNLLSLPSSQLNALAPVASKGVYSQLKAAVTARIAGRQPGVREKALGDYYQDLVFYPITPCRNVDTLNAGGKIAGGSFRDFDANAGASQGGSPGCYAVPSRDASAWALNEARLLATRSRIETGPISFFS